MDTPPVPDWLRNANIAFGTPAPPPGNWLTAGLGSGFHGLLSDIGSLGQGIGSVTGWQGLQQAGQNFAQSQQEAEKASENPYYEANPWSLGGIGYRVAKSLPGLVPAVAATAALPEAAVPAWLARAGMAAPKLLGGVGGAAEAASGGLDAAVAAVKGGRAFGRGIMGAGLGFFPQIAGGNIQAEQGGDTSQPVSRGQALAALAVGAPEAALGGLFPESLFGGSGGKFLGSKILGGAMGAVTVNAVNSGLQTGLNQFLSDTDKPIGERASDIVESALEGGVIGGILGGASHGISALFHPTADTAAIAQDKATVTAPVDAATGFKPADEEPAPTPPQTPAEMPSADLQAQFAALNAKNEADRSQGESAQHLLYGDEIAKRTQPGLNPGEGILYEPDEIVKREPLVQAMRAQVIPEDASPNDPLVKNFNAASEPELVNVLQKRLTDSSDAPQWIVDLAKDRGISSDGEIQDLTPKINDLIGKYEKASIAGDTEKESTLLGKINDFRKLQQTHEQAIDLMMQAKGATPEEIATHLSDIAAQSDARLAEAQSAGPLSRGEPSAVREPSTAGVDVLPASGDGQALGERNAEGTTAGEGQRGQAQEGVGDTQVQTPAKEFLTPVSKRQALSEAVAQAPDLESRIRSAHTELTGGELNKVSQLKDLRAQLPDVPRDVLDAELVRLHNEPDNGITLGASDWVPDRTPDKLLAGVDAGGELAHQLMANPPLIEEPPSPVKTIPPSDDPVTDLKLMYDNETDPDRKMFAAAALATADPVKADSALRALQIAKGFFRNESGSLNLGEIAKTWNKLTGKDRTQIAREVEQPAEPPKFKDMVENQPAHTPQQMSDRIKDTRSFADLAVQDQTSKLISLGDSAKNWLRRTLLPAEDTTSLVKIAGRYLRAAAPWNDLSETKMAIEQGLNKPDSLDIRGYQELKPEVQAGVRKMLIALNDGSNLDYRKKWSDHPEAMRTGSNKDVLMAKHKAGASEWSRLQQNGGAKVVNDILRMNQRKGYEEVGATLQVVREIMARRGMELTAQNPHEAAQFDTDRQDNSVTAYEKARDATWALHKELSDFIAAQDDLGQQSTPEKAKTILAGLEVPRSALRGADARLAQIAEGTYSPLSHGRGDHFVAGKVAVDDAGRPRAEALNALQDAWAKEGFHNFGLFHDGENNSVMMRLETASQMEQMENIFKGLEKQGHMIEGETRSGRPNDPIKKMMGVAPKYVQSLMAELSDAVDQSDQIDPEQRELTKHRLISQIMDMLPDHSVIPNLERRTYAQGFDTDMVNAAMERAAHSSRSSTAIAMSGRTADARTAMSNEVKAAQKDPALRPKERLIGSDVLRELATREASEPWKAPYGFLDMVRSGTRAIEVGANFAYPILPMSQILTLSHGELAKTYGNVRAAKALASSATEAFNALRVMFKSPDWATLGIRASDMRAAGNISERGIDTIMRLANSGKLSTFTRSLSSLGEGSGKWSSVKIALERMNAFGSYAEMYPRLITGLAADKLHTERYGSEPNQKGQTKEQYVGNAVSESQFNWGPGQTARLATSKGPLGPFGKFAFAFTGFRTRVIGKLYTEFHDLITGDNPENTRKEAGTFLASHLLATTMLAGTLGLPAAGMLAGIFDRLYATFTGKDDMDIEGTYRTWLTNVFGAGTADVLAKGLPRALGVDLSKIGEHDLLPFTEAVQEKRKFEDATEEWINHMAGPSIAEAKDLVLGLRDVVNGDYQLGLIKALPGSMKDLTEAYRLDELGHYVNDRGQALPITPSALAVLQQALGFTPTNKAQYQEANEIKQGLLAQRLYRSQNIGTHLMRAFNTGDTASVGPWMREAVQYQIDHPMLGGPMQNLQRMIMMSQRGQAQAQALGIPLGVKPQDVGLQSRLGFLGQ